MTTEELLWNARFEQPPDENDGYDYEEEQAMEKYYILKFGDYMPNK